ncbi:MAG TPA: sigma-70 family RNA polymerase sigma factor [Dongiaceae bacterium]|nr:sigma-70 family RNA polymerase sigma factor [Dongiaceae bacterium]
MTDSTLLLSDLHVAQLRRRDHRAFELLVTHLHRPLVAVARAIIGDSLAEEVVQEAWVSVYRALPDFEGRSSLKTWIYTIVGNEARTRLRKEKRIVALEDLAEPGVDYLDSHRFHADGHWGTPPPDWHIESPDQLLEEAQLQKCIEVTLEQLNPNQKAVFTLRDLEQQSLEEICNILQLSDSNVRVLLHRARLRLLQVIDRYQVTGEC